jgi:hypothetical protein
MSKLAQTTVPIVRGSVAVTEVPFAVRLDIAFVVKDAPPDSINRALEYVRESFTVVRFLRGVALMSR